MGLLKVAGVFRARFVGLLKSGKLKKTKILSSCFYFNSLPLYPRITDFINYSRTCEDSFHHVHKYFISNFYPKYSEKGLRIIYFNRNFLFIKALFGSRIRLLDWTS